tara:strand:- start:900 stop:1214 length:315 start_codon:yes stop_codon:yes gene_type:complete
MSFEEWYSNIVKNLGINPNPDDVEHFYDYRAAHKAGEPIPEPGQHMSSKYKNPLHPERFISGKKLGREDIALWDTLKEKPANIQEVVVSNYLRNELLKDKRYGY